VDWSAATPGGKHQLIRVSVASQGRALTIFEAICTDKTYNCKTAHQVFLAQLKFVLPQNCKPIIVTDADFTNTFLSCHSYF